MMPIASKMSRVILVALLATGLGAAYAQSYTQDTGLVSSIYVTADGGMAFSLTTTLTNAKKKFTCQGPWIGRDTDLNAAFKAAILSAKATSTPLKVTIDGCAAGGSWFSVMDIYVGG
jgi:hypothetical protein